MMYEAGEQGIHTIWIRGFDPKTGVDAFGLPEYMIPVMMLGLGYPKPQAKAHPAHFDREPVDFLSRKDKVVAALEHQISHGNLNRMAALRRNKRTL